MNPNTTPPEWARYVRVDEVIECYPISKTTESELMRLMPNAYGGEVPGEDDWPEPDASRDAPYKLSVIWDSLTEESKSDLIKAKDQ